MFFPYNPDTQLEKNIVGNVGNMLGLKLNDNPFQPEDFPDLARNLKVLKNQKAHQGIHC